MYIPAINRKPESPNMGSARVTLADAAEAIGRLIIDHADAIAQDMGYDGSATGHRVSNLVILTLDNDQEFTLRIMVNR